MKKSRTHHLFPGIDPVQIACLPILDDYHEGVMVTDEQGVVLYMNNAQARIDDLDIDASIGRRVSDLYQVDEGTSPTMICLKTGKPIVNLACYYRTHLGRVVNSIHNVYPIRAEGRIIGAVCTIIDYKNIEQTFLKVDSAKPARSIATFGVAPLVDHTKSRANGTRYTFDSIIGAHPDLLAAVKTAKMASRSPSPIMIYGETGTGKEMIAQSIHNQSPRQARPYVAINCAAIPENLLEGMLFGTSRGAFTGAIDKAGMFEAADGGSLFLDEVNSMSPSLQAKLLRVLQERRVRRVGAMQEIDVDLKIISSVNVAPHEAIARGGMRPDLFYRLAVVFVEVPPLRKRMSDLNRLITHFLAKTNTILGKQVSGISMEVMDWFQCYDWPGNIRELAHVIEGAMNLIGDEASITIQHLSTPHRHAATRPPSSSPVGIGQGEDGCPPSVNATDTRQSTLAEEKARNETKLIVDALTASQGKAAQAARQLGISPQLMHYKLKRLGIDRKGFQKTSSPKK